MCISQNLLNSYHPLKLCDVNIANALNEQVIYYHRQVGDGKKASHNNFLSEPHSPHFLVRATSKFLSLSVSQPGKNDDAPKEACLNFGQQCFKCLYFNRPKKTKKNYKITGGGNIFLTPPPTI